MRYPGYDYAQAGAVFITICTYGRQDLFGDVVDGEMCHSPAGRLAIACWKATPTRYESVENDAFVVMPDHIHAILLTGIDPGLDAHRDTVGFVVRGFKSSVAAGYRKGVERDGWIRYDRHLWQRDYHDRIVRNERELQRLQRYIEGNPGRWWEKQEAERAARGTS